jgi:hypothetical protein
MNRSNYRWLVVWNVLNSIAMLFSGLFVAGTYFVKIDLARNDKDIILLYLGSALIFFCIVVVSLLIISTLSLLKGLRRVKAQLVGCSLLLVYIVLADILCLSSLPDVHFGIKAFLVAFTSLVIMVWTSTIKFVQAPAGRSVLNTK